MYRGQEEEEDEVFRIMFEEGIEASYFKSIIHEDFQQKSTRHFKKIKE